MTRAHARLLGPCFKTGPESTQSYSVADWRSVGPSESSAANSRTGAGTAPGPCAALRPSLRRAGREQVAAQRHVRTVGRAGRATAGPRGTALTVRAGSTAGLGPAPNGSRRPTRGEVHAFGAGRRQTARSGANAVRRAPNARRAPETRLNLPVRPFGFLRFTPERFHVLLNSLFKVLFNFPSRYLFAIGLVVVFSLRWSLPPA
jgi:hypothetical protein